MSEMASCPAPLVAWTEPARHMRALPRRRSCFRVNRRSATGATATALLPGLVEGSVSLLEPVLARRVTEPHGLIVMLGIGEAPSTGPTLAHTRSSSANAIIVRAA